jgi:hypothetical protein
VSKRCFDYVKSNQTVLFARNKNLSSVRQRFGIVSCSLDSVFVKRLSIFVLSPYISTLSFDERSGSPIFRYNVSVLLCRGLQRMNIVSVSHDIKLRIDERGAIGAPFELMCGTSGGGGGGDGSGSNRSSPFSNNDGDRAYRSGMGRLPTIRVISLGQKFHEPFNDLPSVSSKSIPELV